MYLDPYEIAHVFCGNFSLFCFLGWEGGGGVLKQKLSTSATCDNTCAEHPLQRQKKTTTLVPYILHTFTCFTCPIIFFLIAVCLSLSFGVTTALLLYHSWCFFYDFFDKPIKERGSRGSRPSTLPGKERWCHKQRWRKHARATFTSSRNYLNSTSLFHGSAQCHNRSMCGFVIDGKISKLWQRRKLDWSEMRSNSDTMWIQQ